MKETSLKQNKKCGNEFLRFFPPRNYRAHSVSAEPNRDTCSGFFPIHSDKCTIINLLSRQHTTTDPLMCILLLYNFDAFYVNSHFLKKNTVYILISKLVV